MAHVHDEVDLCLDFFKGHWITNCHFVILIWIGGLLVKASLYMSPSPANVVL